MGDLLLAVDGFPVATLPVASLAARLTGAGGSQVELTLRRPAAGGGAGGEDYSVVLVRGDAVPPPRAEL